MRFPDVMEKKVLITGCSTGIGRAAALMLRDRGWQVVATARRESDLESLRDDGLNAVPIELADEQSVRSGFETALDMFEGRLGALVNNAGYGQPGALEDVSRRALRTQFEVNVIGMQQLTNLCIPGFRRQGYGRIVNVSSMLGRITMPFMGAYCASKYAMEALSDALRVELQGSGIAVALVEPGPIRTSFGDNALDRLGQLDSSGSPFHVHYETQRDQRRKERGRDDMFRLPPEAVGSRIVAALERRRPKIRYKVTIPAYIGAAVRRLVPDRLVDHIFTKVWEKRSSP